MENQFNANQVPSIQNTENSREESSMSGIEIFGILLLICTGGFLAFAIFASQPWDIGPEWNIFESPLATPLFTIGFIKAMFDWIKGKRHYSDGEVYNKVEYSSGRVEYHKNNDIIDNTMLKIFWPIIMHILIEPLIIACIIYYPLMFLWSLVHGILPYVLVVLLLVIIGVYVAYAEKLNSNALMLLVAVAIAGAFVWFSITLMEKRSADKELLARYTTVLEAEGIDYSSLDKNGKVSCLNRLKQLDAERTEMESVDLSEVYQSNDLGKIPTYMGGEAELNDYFSRVIGPKLAELNLKKINVEAECLIDQKGNLRNVVITKSSGNPQIDSLYIEALNSLPQKWNPGSIDGRNVNCYIKIPLVVSLS